MSEEKAIISMEEYKALKALKDENLVVVLNDRYSTFEYYSISKVSDKLEELVINYKKLHESTMKAEAELLDKKLEIGKIKEMTILEFIKWSRN